MPLDFLKRETQCFVALLQLMANLDKNIVRGARRITDLSRQRIEVSNTGSAILFGEFCRVSGFFHIARVRLAGCESKFSQCQWYCAPDGNAPTRLLGRIQRGVAGYVRVRRRVYLRRGREAGSLEAVIASGRRDIFWDVG